MATNKLLAIFAHPDDETVSCAGTLALLAESGWDLTLICATRGEKGRRMGKPPFTTREQLPFVREQELKKACEVLGVSNPIFLDIPDKEVEEAEKRDLEERLISYIQEIKPVIVITFGLMGRFAYHPDHRAISRAATAAFYKAKTAKELYYPLFQYEALDPKLIEISSESIVAVNIEKTWTKKVLAYKKHLTQFQQEDWLWGDNRMVETKIPRKEYFIKVYSESTNFLLEENLIG
ncbi:PIG-L family deacetylase [Microaerobacter geothermalis]|uniref:PIG-L deacetylase family protein n=1 Tax=Microaerobacter geothermalis TaxID=674972 RepID=UPI001F1C3694|nr:PIG-L family deacetylase [Microaerobacter geothermalis]MCF6092476.1 PIG-L family deacetylase [Microaerobacter geothermalis]